MKGRPLLRRILTESLLSQLGQPGRVAVAVIVLSITGGGAVLVSGLTAMTSQEVLANVNQLRATYAELLAQEDPRTGEATLTLDAEMAVSALQHSDVLAVGVMRRGEAVPIKRGPRSSEAVALAPVVEMSATAQQVLGVQLVAGRSLTDEDVELDLGSALLGHRLASRLGIGPDMVPTGVRGPDDIRHEVVGIVGTNVRGNDLSDSIILPTYPHQSPDAIVLEISPGSARRLAQVLPLLLAPEQPGGLRLESSVAFEPVRDQVAETLASSSSVLTLVMLAASGLLVCGIQLQAAWRRTPEIGLRRAIGAQRWHIGVHVLASGLLLGVLGAVGGVLVGTASIHVVARTSSTPAVIDPTWLVGTALAMVLASTIGALIPAYVAGRLEPVDALRPAIGV